MVVISYDSAEGTLVLFTRSSRLIYDLNDGTVMDENEVSKKVTVSYRNGMLFIPAVQAASHFGLSVSLLTSETGCQVIRFTNGQQVYNNDDFIDKAETLISFYLEYEAKQQEQGAEQTNPEVPTEEETPPEELGPVVVYLAIAGDAVSEDTLKYLDSVGLRGTFFLTKEQFEADRELARRIYAAGHVIGLTVSQEEIDPAAALKDANAAMDKALFYRSTLALLPTGIWESSAYQLLLEQTQAMGLEQILAQEELLPRLLVCRDNVPTTIGRLLQAEAVILQILETTRLS